MNVSEFKRHEARANQPHAEMIDLLMIAPFRREI